MRSHLYIGLLCVVMFLSSTYADVIYLKNGDKITGKIAHMADGKLVLQSELAGTVTIDISNIRTLSSDAPVKIHLNDGTVLDRRIMRSEDDHFAIEQTPAIQAQTIQLSAIESINPPVKPEPKWKGNISAGYNSSHGNTNTDNVTISANLKKRTEKDRTKISGDYAKSREKDETTGKKETTEDWWKIKGNYDYFLTEKFFVFAEASYEKDRIALLDRRVIIGGGGGYQWAESEELSFSTRAGVASLYEKFDNQTGSNSELSALLGYDLENKLRENITFIHSLTYYPSFEKFSDYFLSTSAEIKADVTPNIFTNFKVLFDYDATPAVGSGKTDVKYIWGVGASF